MASEHTTNFGLSQWALSDDVRMEDFNADNLRLENALSRTACFRTGSYTGDGTYGAEHPNTLAFDFAPALVIVTFFVESTGEWFQMIAVRGAGTGVSQCRPANSTGDSRLAVHLTWGTDSLSWYSGNEYNQGNRPGAVYLRGLRPARRPGDLTGPRPRTGKPRRVRRRSGESV